GAEPDKCEARPVRSGIKGGATTLRLQSWAFRHWIPPACPTQPPSPDGHVGHEQYAAKNEERTNKDDYHSNLRTPSHHAFDSMSPHDRNCDTEPDLTLRREAEHPRLSTSPWS